MRFAIATADRYLGVFKSLVEAGWEPVKVFTVPQGSQYDAHTNLAECAGNLGVPIQISRITAEDLQSLAAVNCDALVVASYNWRIDDWRPHLKYGVNFHCSPLPEARGPYPVVRAILENRPAWGVTCHQLTPELDGGDILAAEHFPMQPDECHESLDLKIQLAAARLAKKIAPDFKSFWNAANPQTGGSYWPKLSDIDRTLDFNQPVDDIMRRVRAFGNFETLASVNGSRFSIRRAVGWHEAHSHTPGQAVAVHGNHIVVAAADGYIALLEWRDATE